MAQVRWAGARAAARVRHSSDARKKCIGELQQDIARAQRDTEKEKRDRQWKNPIECLAQLGYGQGHELPRLAISVEGHHEEHGCTMYGIDVSLSQKGGVTTWHTTKRLCDLREQIHDPVKDVLGEEAYPMHFGETPFAHFGGVPGTTERLRYWLQALGSCINQGALDIKMIGVVLNFLEAPMPEPSGPRPGSALF